MIGKSKKNIVSLIDFNTRQNSHDAELSKQKIQENIISIQLWNVKCEMQFMYTSLNALWKLLLQIYKGKR